jgi:hypothetical protein
MVSTRAQENRGNISVGLTHVSIWDLPLNLSLQSGRFKGGGTLREIRLHVRLRALGKLRLTPGCQRLRLPGYFEGTAAMKSIDDAVTELGKAYSRDIDHETAAKVLEEVGACRMGDLRNALKKSRNGDISVDFIDGPREKVTFLVEDYAYNNNYVYHPFVTTEPISRCGR